MRFGLVMLKEKDPRNPSLHKRLTFEERGFTNNTCIRLDGEELLFGEQPFRGRDGKEFGSWPGRWAERSLDVGKGRLGRQSVWVYDRQKVQITQTVEIVPGEQSRLLDTCLVRYLIENRDSRPHSVGLRFLLDTYIGANDGVPFTIPGAKQPLCDTMLDFNRMEDIPQFIQALERGDLAKPGTIAHLQLKLGGKISTPDRVTLGAWPNPRLNSAKDRRFQQEKTMWQVPVMSMKSLTPADSAVVIYWNERPLPPGNAREVGFAYGLGSVASAEANGKLGLTVGGALVTNEEFTVTAYVTSPAAGQTVTLTLPEGFRLAGGSETQTVPPLPKGVSSRPSPVTWKVKAPSKEGKYPLQVSSAGMTQSQQVTIRTKRIFD
jgi:hypothetical protein